MNIHSRETLMVHYNNYFNHYLKDADKYHTNLCFFFWYLISRNTFPKANPSHPCQSKRDESNAAYRNSIFFVSVSSRTTYQNQIRITHKKRLHIIFET